MRIFLLLSLVAIAFSSCCYKSECAGIQEAMIYLEGFAEDEADTVRMVEYVVQNGALVVTDSFETRTLPDNSSGARYAVPLHRGFRADQQYRIHVPGTGESYLLGAFTFNRHLCNRCITGNTYYDQFAGYSVDGHAYTDNQVVIRKR